MFLNDYRKLTNTRIPRGVRMVNTAFKHFLFFLQLELSMWARGNNNSCRKGIDVFVTV